MKSLRALACVAAFVAVTGAPAPAQTLNVPLSSGTRPIQTETLFHELFADFFKETDGTTYVQTGDIPAMWLRDSAAQTIPYVRFVKTYSALHPAFWGVIERDAKNILTDPYAEAFSADYHVWERKWEIDSLSWPVLLVFVYYSNTRDRTIFTPNLHRAMQTIVTTLECEQHHAACSRYTWPDPVPTHEQYNPNTGLTTRKVWNSKSKNYESVDEKGDLAAAQHQFAFQMERVKAAHAKELAAAKTDSRADADKKKEFAKDFDETKAGKEAEDYIRFNTVDEKGKHKWADPSTANNDANKKDYHEAVAAEVNRRRDDFYQRKAAAFADPKSASAYDAFFKSIPTTEDGKTDLNNASMGQLKTLEAVYSNPKPHGISEKVAPKLLGAVRATIKARNTPARPAAPAVPVSSPTPYADQQFQGDIAKPFASRYR